MSFPAFEDFSKEIRLSRNIFRLYMHLQREVLDHREPRQCLIWKLCEQLRMRRASVIRCLNWLVRNGYIIEHNRGERRIRYCTLAWSRAKQHAA